MRRSNMSDEQPSARSPAPLSFNQEHRLRFEWFTRAIGVPRERMHVVLPLSFEHGARLGPLTEALHALVCRHEALRTTFGEAAGDDGAVRQPPTPVAYVSDAAAVPLTVGSLPGGRVTRRQLEAELDAIVSEPFDYARAPLACARLLRRERADILVLVVHHLVCDGLSIKVLAHDLERLYAQCCGDVHQPLPPVSARYSEFATWQREQLAGERLRILVDYWAAEWEAGAADVLTADQLLPMRPPPITGAPLRVETTSLRVGRKLTGRLRSLALLRRATIATIALAAFARIAARRRGQPHLTIWVNFANRAEPRFAAVVGWFANAHIVRVDADADDGELCRQLRHSLSDAQRHQDLPFALLWQHLLVRFARSRHVSASLEAGHVTFDVVGPSPQGRGQLALKPLGVRSHIGENTFKLLVADLGPSLRLDARYATDCFDADAVQGLLHDFRRALELAAEGGLATGPSQRPAASAIDSAGAP